MRSYFFTNYSSSKDKSRKLLCFWPLVKLITNVSSSNSSLPKYLVIIFILFIYWLVFPWFDCLILLSLQNFTNSFVFNLLGHRRHHAYHYNSKPMLATFWIWKTNTMKMENQTAVGIGLLCTWKNTPTNSTFHFISILER